MTISADTLRKLAALALDPEQMTGVLNIIAEIDEADSARRAKQRERKARSRDKSVTVTGQERDGHRDMFDTPADKESVPQTPLKEINHPLSLEAPACAPEAALRIEFGMSFWPIYPHKVGKRFAMAAWLTARRRASLAAIVEGLQRYIRDKPPDREWLNPATFLNQDRWTDEPAKRPAANGQRTEVRSSVEIHTTALAGVVARRRRERERQANPDAWPGGETGAITVADGTLGDGRNRTDH